MYKEKTARGNFAGLVGHLIDINSVLQFGKPNSSLEISECLIYSS